MSLWHRRDFLIASGAAMGSLPGLTAAAGAALALPSAASPARLIVADTRFAESRAFAAEAARSGQRIAWIEGDVTDLWYEELDLRWRSERVTVSGLTEYGAFFCLERLGMDRGMRVAFKREQSPSLLGWVIASKPARRIKGAST